LRQRHYSQWLEQTNKDAKVEFTSPAFLGNPAAPAK